MLFYRVVGLQHRTVGVDPLAACSAVAPPMQRQHRNWHLVGCSQAACRQAAAAAGSVQQLREPYTREKKALIVTETGLQEVRGGMASPNGYLEWLVDNGHNGVK